MVIPSIDRSCSKGLPSINIRILKLPFQSPYLISIGQMWEEFEHCIRKYKHANRSIEILGEIKSTTRRCAAAIAGTEIWQQGIKIDDTILTCYITLSAVTVFCSSSCIVYSLYRIK